MAGAVSACMALTATQMGLHNNTPLKPRVSILSRMPFIFVFSLFFLLSHSLQAQIGLGSWNILNMKYTYDKKWSFFAEAQLRSLQFYNNFHYYEYKGGLTYVPQKGVRLTLGMGSYQTYREGGDFVLPKNNDEFRVWPQLALSQSFGKLTIEQRYRAEMRFTSNGYRNRFRYRLGAVLPFGKLKNGKQAFQFGVNDELFFTDKEPFFERNRLQFTLGYKPTQASAVQLGYLNQFDYKINDETGRDFLVVGFYFDLQRKKSTIDEAAASKDN